MVADGQGRGASGRKRKRPLPASESSKSTTTNSGGGGGQRGGTCPISASLCSTSATTQSLSGANHGGGGAGNNNTSNGGAAAAATAGGHGGQAKKRARSGGLGEAEELSGAGGGGAGPHGAHVEGAKGRRALEDDGEPEEGDEELLLDEEDEDEEDDEDGEGEAADLDLMDEGEDAGADGRRRVATRLTAGAGAAEGSAKGRRKGEGAAAGSTQAGAAGGSGALLAKRKGKAKGEGARAVAAGRGAGRGGKGLPEMVRRVEKLVAVMFKELDVLLRAEDINRRVMYRWSGAERSSSAAVGEGKTSYCTWGRELIKQYVEDAIDLVRTSLATGDWDNSVEAARRLTLLYLTKASERTIIENEPLLHAEVMNTLGNLWFALLPYMPPPQRQQFRRLVARVRKSGGATAVAQQQQPDSGAAQAAAGKAIMASTGGGPEAATAATAAEKAAGATTVEATSAPLKGAMVPGKAGGGGGGGGGNGLGAGAGAEGEEAEAEEDADEGSGLVVSFRCALEFAKLDLSPETLAAHGPAETRVKLAALLVSDVYDCDAYICLWKVSEVLAALPDFRVLCQEFRLKALDAEMWRCMLLEEQETRQRGGSDDSDEDSEEEDEEDDYSDEEEEDSKGGGDRLSVNKLATIPGVVGVKKFESTQMLVQRSAAAAAAAAAQQAAAAPQQQQPQQPPRVSFLPAAPAPAPPTPAAALSVTAAAAAAAAAAARRAVLDSVTSSRFSSLRRSSALDGQSGSRLGAGGAGQVAAGERWRTKAALEDADYDQYMDFLSLHQHEYRRVMTPDFLFRVWTFLEAFEPLAVAPAQAAAVAAAGASGDAGAAASPRSSGSGGGGDPLSPMRLLFIRARPFLYRVATMIPTEELNGFLDLLAAKFGYQDTLQLLEPLVVEEQEVFSTGRVAQALEWAIDCEGGKHLPLFTRRLLPRIQSRTQLERIARRAIVHGLPSLPILDRALARVPRHNYEPVALALCRRAVECWGMGRGAHLVVLRALQGMPSLGLYLKCRGCFLDPVGLLVRPLIHQLDPTGELSIGIRLVEGIVQSAVNSIVASLEATREGSPERRDKGRRWLDFCFAGVRGGQFPPVLLDRLFAAPALVTAALGAPSKDPSCMEALAACFARLAELARRPNIHPSAVSGPVRSIVAMYTHHAPKDVLLRVAVEKGIEMEETAIEVAA